jgi:hypothetical protein
MPRAAVTVITLVTAGSRIAFAAPPAAQTNARHRDDELDARQSSPTRGSKQTTTERLHDLGRTLPTLTRPLDGNDKAESPPVFARGARPKPPSLQLELTAATESKAEVHANGNAAPTTFGLIQPEAHELREANTTTKTKPAVARSGAALSAPRASMDESLQSWTPPSSFESGAAYVEPPRASVDSAQRTWTPAAPLQSDTKLPAPQPPTPPAGGLGPLPKGPPRPGEALRIAGLASAGVGVAALGAGAFFHVRSEMLTADHCTTKPCDEKPSGAAATSATVSHVMLGVGAAAVLGGAIMFFSGISSKQGVGVGPFSTRKTASASKPGIVVSPFTSRAGGGAAVMGQW